MNRPSNIEISQRRKLWDAAGDLSEHRDGPARLSAERTILRLCRGARKVELRRYAEAAAAFHGIGGEAQ